MIKLPGARRAVSPLLTGSDPFSNGHWREAAQ